MYFVLCGCACDLCIRSRGPGSPAGGRETKRDMGAAETWHMGWAESVASASGSFRTIQRFSAECHQCACTVYALPDCRFDTHHSISDQAVIRPRRHTASPRRHLTKFRSLDLSSSLSDHCLRTIRRSCTCGAVRGSSVGGGTRAREVDPAPHLQLCPRLERTSNRGAKLGVGAARAAPRAPRKRHRPVAKP